MTGRLKLDHTALLRLNSCGQHTRILPGPYCDQANIMIRQWLVNLTRRPATHLVLLIYRQLQQAYNFHHVWPTHFVP